MMAPGAPGSDNAEIAAKPTGLPEAGSDDFEDIIFESQSDAAAKMCPTAAAEEILTLLIVFAGKKRSV